VRPPRSSQNANQARGKPEISIRRRSPSPRRLSCRDKAAFKLCERSIGRSQITSRGVKAEVTCSRDRNAVALWPDDDDILSQVFKANLSVRSDEKFLRSAQGIETETTLEAAGARRRALPLVRSQISARRKGSGPANRPRSGNLDHHLACRQSRDLAVKAQTLSRLNQFRCIQKALRI